MFCRPKISSSFILFLGIEGIHLTMTREGRPSGEAYVEMATDDDVERALKKDRQNMGKRYVEGKTSNFFRSQIICLDIWQ